VKKAAAAAAALGAAAVLYFADPAVARLHPPCLMRLYTEHECAGCGAARARHAMLHGRVEEAWRLNALWTAVAPALAGRGAWPMRRKRRGGEGA
jgi:hypothetical protein